MPNENRNEPPNGFTFISPKNAVANIMMVKMASRSRTCSLFSIKKIRPPFLYYQEMAIFNTNEIQETRRSSRLDSTDKA